MTSLLRLASRLAPPRPLSLLGRRSSRQPRVAHVTESLEVGGVASLIGAACARLPAEELPCFCICMDARGDRTPVSIPDQMVLSLGQARQSTSRRILRLAQALRQLQVDILHTHDACHREGAAAALLARVPFLLHSQSGSPPPDGDALQQAAVLLTDRFLVSSRHSARALEQQAGVPGRRIRVLLPTVDVSRFRPDLDRELARRRLGVGPGQLLIGSAGRLQPSRNYPMLLEAIGLLRSEGLDVRCVLVGDGLEADTLSHQARQLGITDRLQITGFTREVPQLLAAMDIFVLPSSSPHLPQSLIEAMATGLTVVVGSGGPIPELVRDGENGLLVPPDRPKILARILAQLAENAPRRAALGERARGFVKAHHSDTRVAGELTRLYGELVGTA